jgi:hypothetical protein
MLAAAVLIALLEGLALYVFCVVVTGEFRFTSKEVEDDDDAASALKGDV